MPNPFSTSNPVTDRAEADLDWLAETATASPKRGTSGCMVMSPCGHYLTPAEVRTIWGRFTNACRRTRGHGPGRPRKIKDITPHE